MKYQFPLLAAVGVGLFIVIVARHQESQEVPAPAAPPPLPQPQPQIVFEPNLKLKGSILSGDISTYTTRNRGHMIYITVESLSVSHDRNIRPYPQYRIEDIPKIGQSGQGYALDDRPLPLGKTMHGFRGTDLNKYLVDKNHISAVRMKVVMIEGAGDPKFWTNPTSVVRYSQWMPLQP